MHDGPPPGISERGLVAEPGLVDAGLAGRAKRGDRDAFAELVERHQRRAHALARRMLDDDRDEAMDVAQEAFERAYGALDRFREGEPFAPWFYRILYRLCLHRLVKRRRELAMGERVAQTPSGAPGPEEAATRADLAATLSREVRALPAPYRFAFLMRHCEEMGVADIAAAMDRPVGTVKTLLFRARELLRRRLEEGSR